MAYDLSVLAPETPRDRCIADDPRVYDDCAQSGVILLCTQNYRLLSAVGKKVVSQPTGSI